MKNVLLGIVYSLALIGSVFTGTMFHEGYHVLKNDKTHSVCLDVGADNIMHVEGTGIYDRFEEPKAYAIGGMITLLLFTLVFTGMYYQNH